jgi:hypothetical protein
MCWCTRTQEAARYRGGRERAQGIGAGQSTGILLVLGLLKPRKSFAERHILLDRAPGLPI